MDITRIGAYAQGMSTSTMNTTGIVKANVVARLSSLTRDPDHPVTAYAASVGSGHRAGWITDILGRHDSIGSAKLDELAAALGVPVPELVREGADMAIYSPPSWVDKSTGGEK